MGPWTERPSGRPIPHGPPMFRKEPATGAWDIDARQSPRVPEGVVESPRQPGGAPREATLKVRALLRGAGQSLRQMYQNDGACVM